MSDDGWSSPTVAQLAALITEESGLVLPPQRRPELETALGRLARENRLGDGATFAARALVDPALREQLIGEVTVGETYFFRDRAQIDYLRDRVLPELERERGAGAELRLWSAGCASGEEAWTLAMVLDVLQLSQRAHVIGSDISPRALARARAGVYRAWSLRGAESAPARAYLRQQGTELHVADSLRKQVSFQLLNLAGDSYPSLVNGIWGMDVIFCRNVLIYFDAETVAQVARRLHACLRDDGWLFTAPSDPPLHELAPLSAEATDHGIVYRRRPPAPLVRIRPTAPLKPAPLDARARRRLTPPPRRPAPPGPAAAPASSSSSSGPPVDDEVAAVRRLVQRGELAAAALRSERALATAPMLPELQLLRALILGELGRGDEAVEAARRALYLEPRLAVAHFILASLLERRGDGRGARRSYRNALELVEQRPEDEAIALGDGETAGSLAERARHQLSRLGGTGAPA